MQIVEICQLSPRHQRMVQELVEDLAKLDSLEKAPMVEGKPGLFLLTLKEIKVLNFIGEGLANKQIGARMGKSEPAVKKYVGRILRKLNAESRTEAVVTALRQGVISMWYN